ncbi:MAG TPA: VWA domain-containing protein [Candidatus Acidoferrum sp.]|nr:VWA domain-containing protein [Candidatus Acidoferrum sp.]
MSFRFRFRAAYSLIAGVALAPFVPLALAQEAAPPAIHLDVDRVNVGVVVTDSSGRFVTGLRRGDFRLFDDGTEQPITDFLSAEEPAQVLLLIEAGPAVYLLEEGHLAAVQALLNGLAPSDRVAIARYNEGAEAILDFTTDKRVAAAALDRLQFNLGFGQLNLAASMNTALDWLAHVPGKKSLVILTTGVDTTPASAMDVLLRRLKTSDVRTLLISLAGELRSGQPAGKKPAKQSRPAGDKNQVVADALAHADEELRVLAEANGGRVYFPESPRDFASVFAEIAQIVRHEYNLGFVPPADDGKLHAIDVRIADTGGSSADVAPLTGYRIAHRQAYVAPQ